MARSKSVSSLTHAVLKTRRFFYFRGTVKGSRGIRFTKLNARGNDFIFVRKGDLSSIYNIEAFVKAICDRHRGIGADGVITTQDCDEADFRTVIYNADGSRAQICGNGICCTARLFYESGLLGGDSFTLLTDVGIKRVGILNGNDGSFYAEVCMGKPIYDVAALPALVNTNPFIGEELEIDDVIFRATLVSVGNPHCVLFFREVESDALLKYGEMISKSAVFPEGVNTELCSIVDRATIRMRVIERGAGLTSSCGSGACAAAAAAVANGLCDNAMEVIADGGSLSVRIDRSSGELYLKGSAERVCSGRLYITA